jgi:hypothetical protein
LRINGVKRVFRVDESGDAALFLRLSCDLQRERRLAGAFRPVNFDDAALGQAANAERNIEAERARRDRLDLHDLPVAEPHERALAERLVDLGDRRL